MGEMHRTLKLLRGDDAAELAPAAGARRAAGAARARARPPASAIELDGRGRAARRSPRASTRPRTGSCRRRSPTWSSTPARAHTTVTLGYRPDALELTIADERRRRALRGEPRRPRAGRHARARGAVRRHARRPARATGTASRCARRSPTRHVDEPLRVVIADDQPMMRAGFKAVLEATGSIEVVAEAGDRRGGGRGGRGAPARRRADGHPDAGHGRHRGDAPAAAPARAHPHHLRARRVHRRGAARGRQRLPAQGRADAASSSTRCARSRPATPCSPPRSPASCSTRSARRLPAAVSRTPDGLAELTDREREVLRLLAGGLSNAEIAAGARRLRADGQDATSPTCSASSACATACRP